MNIIIVDALVVVQVHAESARIDRFEIILSQSLFIQCLHVYYLYFVGKLFESPKLCRIRQKGFYLVQTRVFFTCE